jgi:hypothetical protein
MTAHTERAHAKLSPSASKRWMECPGSIRLSEGIEQTSSIFADEGTAAHTLAEHCLSNGYNAERFAEWWIDIRTKDARARFVESVNGEPRDEYGMFQVDDEMVEGVQTYLDYIRGMKGSEDEMDVEFRFDLQHISEGMFGTGDCVIYQPRMRRLIVVDFKYGRGVPVDPESNPQLLCYGLGALKRHGNRPVTTIMLAIVQPRCNHPKGPIREWTTNALDLLDFEVDLRDAAEQTQKSDAPLKAGDWCGFCPAAATCPALRAKSVEMAGLEFEAEGAPPEGMTPEELSGVLEEVGIVEKWCIRVKKFAHDLALGGGSVPGWKLVDKRAIRKWKSDDEAAKLLQLEYGLSDEDVFIKKMKSPAQLEPLMPGKNKDLRGKAMAPLVKKESSGLVLVPVTDKRPPANSGGSEFDEVET